MNPVMEGILGQIGQIAGQTTGGAWYCCDNCGDTVQADDCEATCLKCNQGRMFRGSTKQIAVNLATRSAKAKAGLGTTKEEEAQVKAAEKPAEKNPVFNAAEEVRAKMQAEKKELQEKLDELGIPYSGRLGVASLRKLLESNSGKEEAPASSGARNSGTAAGSTESQSQSDESEVSSEPSSQVEGGITRSEGDNKMERTESRETTGIGTTATGSDKSVTEEEIGTVEESEPEIVEEQEQPKTEVSGDKPDYKAIREAATKAFVEKHNLSEVAPVTVGTAEVQTCGVTVWTEGIPAFRFQQPFESGSDFSKVYDQLRAAQPSCKIDVVQCNNVSNQELKKCLYNGDMIASLNNGNGTTFAKPGQTVRIGALKTSKGNLRFVVLEILR